MNSACLVGQCSSDYDMAAVRVYACSASASASVLFTSLIKM